MSDILGWLDIHEVAAKLNISSQTINIWYGWQCETGKGPKLPQYARIGSKKLWPEETIAELIAFKKWVPRGRFGVMAEFRRKRRKFKR